MALGYVQLSLAPPQHFSQVEVWALIGALEQLDSY